MTETQNTDPGQTAKPKARIVNHFIKALTFETPNMGALLANRTDNPELTVSLTVDAMQVDGPHYESVTHFKATAVGTAGTVYEIDLKHASLVELGDLPREQMERALLLEAPRLAFPFLRRFVADLTRESGFPPLLLDPVDFTAVFATRQAQSMPVAAE